MRLAIALPALILLACPAQAQAQSILAAVRNSQWQQADALAAAEPDPLARRIVLYYRLLTPGAARATEIAAFMLESPDWPQQALLSRRLQDALATDHDDKAVLAICQQQVRKAAGPAAPPQSSAAPAARPQSSAEPAAPPQSSVPSLLRCADLATRAVIDDPAAAARRAWLTSITDASSEAAFMHRWAAQVTADDQWRRFDRLAWTESPAPGAPLARQAIRVAPAQRPAAETRLALRRDDPAAPAMFNALPANQRDPGLVLDLARWYRRAGQDRDAARVWTTLGPAAEAAAPPERRSTFWDERNLLARRLLRANDAATAYAVVETPAASREAALDCAFLAGWIALRRLDAPAQALPHFTALAALSPAALTQSRAHYWLGRTLDATHDPAAQAEYEAAARWPTTYYGQLAAIALGDDAASLAARVAAARDPDWTEDRALVFLARDGARAAVLLTAWGEPRRAKAFIARLDELATDATDRALAARLALGLGLPEQAVAVARRAGRDGVMLPGAGWPAAATPPEGAVEQSVVLGLIRQESSFDVQALSPVGARGLMQLMPATAAEVARKLGVIPNLPALTTDPAFNMRLGTTYLGGLLARFGQALPLAIAGYNAGPGRVQDWTIGVSLEDDAAMIDWIELIPFNETRNYVQRVIENIIIYRAQLGATAPHPVQVPRG